MTLPNTYCSRPKALSTLSVTSSTLCTAGALCCRTIASTHGHITSSCLCLALCDQSHRLEPAATAISEAVVVSELKRHTSSTAAEQAVTVTEFPSSEKASKWSTFVGWANRVRARCTSTTACVCAYIPESFLAFGNHISICC
eukprot:18336-Heterococcus_DN1.PRE.2